MTAKQTVRLEPTQRGIIQAADFLRQGENVAFPTETVYGLGGDARNDSAVAGIFAAKDRPSFNPLIVHVPTIALAEQLVIFNDSAARLAKAFWPGALTLVLPLRPDANLSSLVTAGLKTLAIRVPDHPLAQSLLSTFGGPVAAPSANPSGRISPTSCQHVMKGLNGKIRAVIDGGACAVGLESTIVSCTERPHLLREGGIPEDALSACLGAPLARAQQNMDQPNAPGQLASHYAPKGSVRLGAVTAEPGEVLLGFGRIEGTLSLSRSGDLKEAAARLFDCLHQFDAMGAKKIAVAPVPDVGLGAAINDRLRRAAAPRG